MSPDMIDAMIAAGLTREQMAALLKHELAKQDQAKAEKRAKDADRQRRHRSSRNVTVTPSDCCDTPTLNDVQPNPVNVQVSLNPPPYSPPALEKPDLGFDEFWQAYPRRQGTNSRKNAEARFRSAVKSGSDPATIIDGARRYAEQCDATGKTGSEFVKAAEAWLNGRLWECSYAITASRAPPHRQAKRNTALDGLDELQRRHSANVQQPSFLRIAG